MTASSEESNSAPLDRPADYQSGRPGYQVQPATGNDSFTELRATVHLKQQDPMRRPRWSRQGRRPRVRVGFP